MQFINYLKSKLPFYVALSFSFVLASCGSYQYVGYDNDGIYGSEDIVNEQPSYNETPDANNNSSYYKNYFAEKAQQFENIPEQDSIFTDVDSYQGDYNEVQDSTYVSGYAGWGENSDDVTINVYPSYAGSYWYSPYSWYWYRPYYSYYGWSYYGYDPYWYSPYYSWYSPYYYGGYFGFNFYRPSWYYYRPYWYGYRNHYYYNGYGYNRYYGSRNVAYNAGRRGAITNYSTNRSANLTNRTSSLNRRSSSTLTRRNIVTRPRSSVNYTTRRRDGSSTVRPRTNTNVRRSYNSTVRPRVRVNSSRGQRPSRSYSTQRRSYNNSSSINRSSSSSRSYISRSSSPSRSSSVSRSSSRSSSGRSSSSSGRRGNQ